MTIESHPPERRAFGVVELRAKGDSRLIAGHAAVFNQLSVDLGGFREQVAPGAFARAIQSDDVRALFNHDANHVLGRNTAKTLRLAEDDHGLAFEIDPPAGVRWVEDLMLSIERGDITQCSFGFRTIRDEWEMAGPNVVRTLLEVRLLDVSPVTFPAYPQTDVGLRAALDGLATFRAAQGQAAQAASDEALGQAVQAEHRRRRLELAARS